MVSEPLRIAHRGRREVRMYRAIFVALPALTLWTGFADAACSVSRWTLTFGQESSAEMTTDGAPCQTTISWTRGTVEVHGARISSPARNGTASAAGNTVRYQPRK